MKRYSTVCMGILFLGGMMMAAAQFAVAADPVITAQHNYTNGSNSGGYQSATTQTFIAGVSGYLEKVQFKIRKVQDESGKDMVVEIRETPTSAPIASITIPGEDLPPVGQEGYFGADFSDEEIWIEEGESYAVGLHDLPDDNGLRLFNYSLTMNSVVGDLYTDGARYVQGEEQVGDDMLFRVYVENGCDAGSFECQNTPPVADAGPDQSAVEGDTVCFDGSGSSDADKDELSYFWTLTEWPAGSSAVLDNPTVDNPCVIADLPGTYRVSLTVNDGTVDSVPSAAEVVVVSSLDAGKSSLQELLEAVKSLDPAVFSKSKKQGRLINKINRAIVQVDKDRYRKALRKIRSILKNTDGCAASGAPDKNDWIRDRVSQEEIYPLLKETIGYLENL